MGNTTIDEQNIEWAEANIEKFLSGFLESSSAENVFLIAHSMGNRGLTRALKSLLGKNPGARSRITEVILAAPDIDAEVFKRDIAPVLTSSKLPITLYASSEDKALKASKLVHGYPRAGDSGDQLLIIDGIETIESTNVKTDFLGHSYFAASDSILADIFVIVNHGHRAKDRFRLEPVNSLEGEYWRFKR